MELQVKDFQDGCVPMRFAGLLQERFSDGGCIGLTKENGDRDGGKLDLWRNVSVAAATHPEPSGVFNLEFRRVMKR